MLTCYNCAYTCKSTSEKWYVVDFGIVEHDERNVCNDCKNIAIGDMVDNFISNQWLAVKAGLIAYNAPTSQWIAESVREYEPDFTDLDDTSEEFIAQIDEWECEREYQRQEYYRDVIGV